LKLFCLLFYIAIMPPSTTPSSTTSKKGRPRLSAIGETPAKSTSDVKQPIPSSVDPVLVPAALEKELPVSASVLLCASTPHETEYLNSLSPIERIVCIIAKEHLQSSFDLDRSNGFISWKKK
jgi:hypothetical protein